MPEMQKKNMEKSKKESEKPKIDLLKNRKIRVVNGLYAIETEDEQPPIENLKFLHESGKFSEEKIPTVEDNTYWYRRQLRKAGIIMAISSFGLLLILLSATTKYAEIAWNLIIFIFNFIIQFFIGLIGAF